MLVLIFLMTPYNHSFFVKLGALHLFKKDPAGASTRALSEIGLGLLLLILLHWYSMVSKCRLSPILYLIVDLVLVDYTGASHIELAWPGRPVLEG